MVCTVVVDIVKDSVDVDVDVVVVAVDVVVVVVVAKTLEDVENTVWNEVTLFP